MLSKIILHGVFQKISCLFTRAVIYFLYFLHHPPITSLPISHQSCAGSWETGAYPLLSVFSGFIYTACCWGFTNTPCGGFSFKISHKGQRLHVVLENCSSLCGEEKKYKAGLISVFLYIGHFYSSSRINVCRF